ncbi:hypothetical protein [Nocardia acidivorans]|uniref:hypothetical protein n=1 Tax=Nocardia acidivorans TaxID=404580 RepID=UPI00082B2CCF|nr:hypothetical protein [Nocardia acidivorans]
MGDFDLARRREVLDEGFRLQARYRTMDYSAGGDAVINKVFELHDEYRAMLPETVVARCPLTGVVVRWALDTADLDGWYWKSDRPVQRYKTQPTSTWLAMKGAVRLAEPPTVAPFRSDPGPGAPFVLPYLLEQPDIRAVITQVPIGRHTAWPITYFGPRRPVDISLEDLWGQDRNPILDPTGLDREYAERLPGRRTQDFDLRGWLDTGKLLWIEPGDATATLREGATGCPYAGIKGDRREQWIFQGKVTRY